jgi:hypothetical protein
MRVLLLRFLPLLTALAVFCNADVVPAQERETVSGRSRPVVVGPTAHRAGWGLSFGGGVLAGGDLFRVVNDLTVNWSAPGAAAADFNAKRFTATLDEAGALAVGFTRRLGARSWLRVDLASGEMKVTALANDSQTVTPVPYDQLTLLLLSLSWEQRLLDTRLQPYLAGGVSWLDLQGASEALTQSRTGIRAAIGLSYRLLERGNVRLEVADNVISVDSEGIPAESGFPASARFTEQGPQHLFALSLQLEFIF